MYLCLFARTQTSSHLILVDSRFDSTSSYQSRMRQRGEVSSSQLDRALGGRALCPRASVRLAPDSMAEILAVAGADDSVEPGLEQCGAFRRVFERLVRLP